MKVIFKWCGWWVIDFRWNVKFVWMVGLIESCMFCKWVLFDRLNVVVFIWWWVDEFLRSVFMVKKFIFGIFLFFFDELLEGCYSDCELLWFVFNEWVLDFVCDIECIFLFERVKFLVIFLFNFDEFFMVWVVGFKCCIDVGVVVFFVVGMLFCEFYDVILVCIYDLVFE